MRETDIQVRMCESHVKKLKGRSFIGASRFDFDLFGYCVASLCMNKGTFLVHLRLSERKVR